MKCDLCGREEERDQPGLCGFPPGLDVQAAWRAGRMVDPCRGTMLPLGYVAHPKQQFPGFPLKLESIEKKIVNTTYPVEKIRLWKPLPIDDGAYDA